MIDRVADVLRGQRFRFVNERDLQDGIALVLLGSGIPFEREVRLSPADRIDFLIGDVGLEVKIDGGLTPLTRQVHRYACLDQVGSLLVVTSKLVLTRLPTEMRGKRVETLVVR